MCWHQVDESAAKLKMEITSKPQHLDEIDRKILQLEMERLSLAKVSSQRWCLPGLEHSWLIPPMQS